MKLIPVLSLAASGARASGRKAYASSHWQGFMP